MGSYDALAHADTIEYYRLTLEARKRDPHARETAKADAETLEMVEKTPDLLEMNRQFMEGGLSFRLARGMAVDGAYATRFGPRDFVFDAKRSTRERFLGPFT